MSSTDHVVTPANRPVDQMRGPSLDCPAMVKEMTLQMRRLAHISRTSTFARTIGPYRLRCRLGARFRSSPNIDNPSFRSRCKALSLKCVELQRKAILNEHGHRKVLQRPEGLRLHSARRWRPLAIGPSADRSAAPPMILVGAWDLHQALTSRRSLSPGCVMMARTVATYVTGSSLP